MNVQRFVGKNAREAMAQARAACGENAVVLSNRPVPGGVEILAMAGDEAVMAAPALPKPERVARDEPKPMSTVSFQDYVRERQRQDALGAHVPQAAPTSASASEREPAPQPARRIPVQPARFAREELARSLPEPTP